MAARYCHLSSVLLTGKGVELLLECAVSVLREVCFREAVYSWSKRGDQVGPLSEGTSVALRNAQFVSVVRYGLTVFSWARVFGFSNPPGLGR